MAGTSRRWTVVDTLRWHRPGYKAFGYSPTSYRTTAMWAKWVLDVSVASVGMLLLFPLLVVFAILIKIDSPGPALFKQTRIGKDGKPFTMYKFRSMYCASDDTIHQEFVRSLFSDCGHGNEVAVYKVADDERITRLGAFLRKSSLDELPQLINVLKGEMSLVGPRPDLPYSVELYEPRHLQRLSVLPGITGLWQVSGRSTKSLLEMLELDIDYVNNWSLWLDIKILVRTVIVVFTGQGAS